MNMNILFDVLTSFKIKFTEHPTPTQVSNMDLVFKTEDAVFSEAQQGVVVPFYKEYKIKGVDLNDDGKRVEIILTEI